MLTYGFVHRNVVIRREAGVLVTEHPAQGTLITHTSWQHGHHIIRPLATYGITARVLSTTRYWLTREAEVSPIDLGVAWGEMSDQAVLDQFDISQGGRFLYLHPRQPVAMSREVITAHVANMHLIPEDDAVGQSLKNIQAGEVVRLDGYLVEVEYPDGGRWKSSLSRIDTGEGACELMWVQGAAVYR